MNNSVDNRKMNYEFSVGLATVWESWQTFTVHLEDLAFMKDTELSKSSNQVLDITFISTQLKKKKKATRITYSISEAENMFICEPWFCIVV